MLSIEAVLSAVENLRSSALYNCSLADKELFHSNFLGWLCQTYPSHVGKFFARFVNNAPDKCDRIDVSRERRRIDLTLRYQNGEQLLIENKVKSLPSMEQLREISASIKKKDRAKTSLLLLTLVRPPFASADGIIQLDRATDDDNEANLWYCITYGDLEKILTMLLPDVIAANPNNSYHGELLKDYLQVIGSLNAIQPYLVVDCGNDDSDFFIADSVAKRMRGIRLHDLVDKLRYEQLARRIEDALRSEGLCVEYCEKLSPAKVRASQKRNRHINAVVGSGMTRSTGLCEFKYIMPVAGNTLVILGVQLQGNKLKLYLEMDNKTKAENAATALWQPSTGNRIWYDFGEPGLDEFPKKGTFNHYGRTFFYRAIRLGPRSPKKLIGTFVKYLRIIRDNEEALCEQLKPALSKG